MPHCTRRDRPCTCGRSFGYDNKGRPLTQDNWLGCLSDEEVRKASSILLYELRCRSTNGEEARLTASR